MIRRRVPGSRAASAAEVAVSAAVRPAAQPPAWHVLSRHPRKGRRTAGRVVAALAGAVAALTAIPLALVAIAPSASAATNQFQGVNWARAGDNFTSGPLVLYGLSSSDSYTTVRAKADAVFAGFERNLGANTVRLPINTYSVGTAWWNSYIGVIDSATARGLKVILSYWDDGRASTGGRLTNTAAFDTMWNTVVDKYGSNSLVHFEPMNEPHGYTAAEWKNVAAAWLAARPSVPRNRVFISGSGFNQDVKTMCADSRFDGTYLSLHHYTFFSGAKTYDAWVNYLKDAIGNCAGRTVIDEFGAPMDTGLNYDDVNSTDNFVRYFRATTQVLRELGMGSVYWPGIGGKITAGQNDDWYAMQKLQGSGTNLTLTTPNASRRRTVAVRLGPHRHGPEPRPGARQPAAQHRLGPLPRRSRRQHRQQHSGRHLRLRHAARTSSGPAPPPGSCGSTATSASTPEAEAPPTARRSSSTTATAAPTSSGPSTATAPSPGWPPGAASTWRRAAPRTAPAFSCGTVRADPTSDGPAHNRPRRRMVT